mmetsp:Transcript_25748/g.59546  ORF Transcript_25748/g.59546 Transcript_25748/m.59546 type:complete len:712 (+) Transcript_25748:95-2230(+)
MKGTVHYQQKTAPGGQAVAVLTMDNKPLNPLSSGVRTGLEEGLKKALSDDAVKAVVVTGASGAFSSGADVAEFATGISGPPLPVVIAALEASHKPVVAAIDGVALGGGCEVALGCHYRLSSERSRVGLPEVNLGILPGAGGTQRLPRLIGVDASVDFMCTGVPLGAQQAQKVGIFDKVVPGDYEAVVAAAIQLAAESTGADLSQLRLCSKTAQASGSLSELLEKKRKAYAASRKGEAAPQAILTCIEAAAQKKFQDGMKVEGKEFGKLFVGDQAKAMQYMFFAERACSKIPGLKVAPGPLDSIGIIGAGLMGGGIAMCCAEAGMKVTLLDVDPKNLEHGVNVIKKNYDRSVQRKSKSQAQVDKYLALITPSTSYDSLGGVDIVVEAVFENMDLKKKIFASLDSVCKPGCVLASNTSGLNIDEIASATKRPAEVIGCHFFSPANVMKLLENVRGPRTSDRTIATAMALGQKIGKVTCLVGNCDWFIANRIIGVSGFSILVNGGLLPHEIDAAAEEYGMRMGPARMADLVGIDLMGRERARKGIAEPTKVVQDGLYAAERYGQKAGKGFYKYSDKLELSRDPVAEELIQEVWKTAGVSKKTMSNDDIVSTLYLPCVNEGFKCMEEGMAMRASDIDVCCVFGFNWPRYRGGPMQWATSIGLPKVLKKLEELQIEPAELLKECVKNNWSLRSKQFNQKVSDAWAARWPSLGDSKL